MNYYLAELEVYAGRGVNTRHATIVEARDWAKTIMEHNPEACGPCEIFFMHERSGNSEHVSTFARHEGKIVETKHIKGLATPRRGKPPT